MAAADDACVKACGLTAIKETRDGLIEGRPTSLDVGLDHLMLIVPLLTHQRIIST